MLIFSKLQISFKILQFKIVKYQIKYIFALLIYYIMKKNKQLQDKLETIGISLLALTLMAGYVWNILIRIV